MNLKTINPQKRKSLFLLLLFLIIFGVTVGVSLYKQRPVVTPMVSGETTLIKLTLAETIKYDGTDTSKPIYLVYEGNIYDVTAGSKYYAPGGSYHWLVGKDATSDLNLVGGDIIKRKYVVVGKITE